MLRPELDVRGWSTGRRNSECPVFGERAARARRDGSTRLALAVMKYSVEIGRKEREEGNM